MTRTLSLARSLLRPLRAAVASLLLACGAPAMAGPVPWPDAPYSYFANNARLEQVLAEFALPGGATEVTFLSGGRPITRTLAELLPEAFHLA